MTTVLVPVPVQANLRRPHPVVAGVRDNRDLLDMKRDTRQRALRLLDAVAKEADRRGYHVSAPTPAPGYARAKGLLVLTITGHHLALEVDELQDRIPHEATAKELREKERYSWTRIPTHDAVPSGRLRMRILDGWPIHQDTFTDTKTVALDDRLSRLLQEMELRAAAFEERRLQHEREEDARRVRWDRAVEEAKVQAREHHRADLLVRQVRDWQGAKAIAAYLDAMTAHIAILTGGPRINAEAWLAWADEYREQLDPLGGELGLPPDPAFTPETLRPFMGGHSPY